MLPLRVDDLVFGISALVLGSMVAVTHGGTRPFIPDEAPVATSTIAEIVAHQAPPAAVSAPEPATVSSPTTPTPPAPAVREPEESTGPSIPREHEREREYEHEFEDD